MIEIHNPVKCNVDEKSFSQVAKNVLSGENRGTKEVSLALVSKDEIHKLNKAFRAKDKPTDVLSFELNDGNYLGEVVICPDVVKEHAAANGVEFQEELYKVFIHGILHLLGYDHERSEAEANIMEQKQETYLSQVPN